MTRSTARQFLRAIVVFSLLGLARAAEAEQGGVVVEEVSKGSSGEKAGIRVGDVLTAWERPANPVTEKGEGKIESAFDWMWLEMEQGPRGMVSVRGQRDGKETIFQIPMGDWGVKVRPQFDDGVLRTYTEGRVAISLKELERGIALWDTSARSAESDNAIGIACWLTLKSADAWVLAQRWKEAQTAYGSASKMAETAMDSVAHALIWDSIGSALVRQSQFGEAEKAYRAALAVRERSGNESLSVARSLDNVGSVTVSRGDLTAAESYFKRALAIRENLALDSLDHAASLHRVGGVFSRRGDVAAAEPFFKRALAIRETLSADSLDVASSLNSLGTVAFNRGDLATSEAYHTRALAIREKLAPDSVDSSRSLNNLGVLTHSRGDLVAAESYYKRALATQEKLAPGSLDVALSLSNLGIVARDRGELSTAEAYHRRALAIRDKLAPDSLDVSASLNEMGIVADLRGDAAVAKTYYQRALAIRERVAPGSLDVAATLNALGIMAGQRGELATATAHHKRALAIWEKLAPDSLNVARSLTNLGLVARDSGDLAMAEAYHQSALAIEAKLASDSLLMAHSLNSLGVVARERGDLTTAETYVKRAVAIRQRLAPGSGDEADSHHALGLVYRKTGQLRLAADHHLRAIDALEAQVGKLGGSQETLSGFGAQFVDYYRDYIDLLVGQHQPAEAFHVLERSRARTLLAMLAERDLVFTADVPEETERERKRIAWEYDQIHAKLAQLNPLSDQVQIDGLLNRIRELRDRQSDTAEQIRQKSPRLASLQYPQPLDLGAVQAALDRGTLLLSYSVHKDKTYLFGVGADGGIQVHTIAIGETQLREDIEKFRSLIQRAQLGADDLTALLDQGRRLYNLLIQPAVKFVDKAQRVLVSPDGPLHLLPYAALVRGVDARAARARRDWQYLVEWKPLHVIVSATVYAELSKQRQNRAPEVSANTLVAFGDPKYPPVAATDDDGDLASQDAIVRSMLRRDYRLAPLPATRREVAAIAGLYEGKAEMYVGDAATEERAKGVAAATRYVHFASHALLDEQFPLNSGLALTIPAEMKVGQDNGILQAWEIFERVRIDADLVVLSACETGLGKEVAGEGLLGLTRAFQYAGARSVLASLWSVADETTAVLMTRFYGYLKSGRSKDAALRQAQLDLIRGSVSVRDQEGRAARVDAAHPFYWAAFQLNGGWQ
jgi:CHAT domain-containing protein/Tfp pilus assembly protein PilF